MARTKSKSQVTAARAARAAASKVPPEVETVSGNDVIAESAPSESVENKAATPMVLDKSEEVEIEEEIRNDPDESEEVDDSQESEDGLEESEEVEEIEEREDGLDESEGGDNIGETADALENSVQGDKEEETEKDEEAEAMVDDVPDRKDEEKVPDEKDEVCDLTGEVRDHDKGESASGKKVKRMRKRRKVAASAAAPNDANKSNDGKGEPITDVVPDGTDEKRATDEKDERVTGEVGDHGKGEGTSGKKAKRMRQGKKTAVGAAALTDANKSSDADKQRTAAAVKESKMADGMGLIFMCNAQTKQECFRWKVFGLPASKKELVAKVYKGMRLFLFDVDLKLMYGIYKAASSGGYNIEPKAFKSAFPSQVRFTLFKDCLPLPEEKFKAAIKDNYYGRNKFNCQLTPEQVRNLCKLFQSAETFSKTKRSREVIRVEPERISSSRSRRSHCERDRRGERDRRDDRPRRSGDLYRRREFYPSPPRRSLALPPPIPAHYAYGQPVQDNYYRRDLPPVGPRDHPIMHGETRNRERLEYRDPYGAYTEPLPREAIFREPLPREAVYREPLPREAAYGEREAVYREPLPRVAAYGERVAAYGEREAVYREPLPREVVYGEPLSREAVYREPVLTQAVNLASLAPGASAASSLWYRY